MPTEAEIYRHHAGIYEELIACEDYQHNIRKAIEEVVRLSGLDVIDMGAGTGRLSRIFSIETRRMLAFDNSIHMLQITWDKLSRIAPGSGWIAVSDHRRLPLAANQADVILSGWSISYLAVWEPDSWQRNLDEWLLEAGRVLRPRGTVILLESLGTGFETPRRLDHLNNYYDWLDRNRFASKWIRTDYQFPSLEAAVKLAGFFFGEALAERIQKEGLLILPECTGLWWRQLNYSK